MINFKDTVTLYGVAYSLKNSRRMVMNRRTGKPMFITNPAAKVALAGFIRQLAAWWGDRDPLPGPVAIKMTLFYPNRKHDGSDDIVKDALEAAGCVRNDRDIHWVQYQKALDKARPRVELWVGPMADRHQAPAL